MKCCCAIVDAVSPLQRESRVAASAPPSPSQQPLRASHSPSPGPLCPPSPMSRSDESNNNNAVGSAGARGYGYLANSSSNEPPAEPRKASLPSQPTASYPASVEATGAYVAEPRSALSAAAAAGGGYSSAPLIGPRANEAQCSPSVDPSARIAAASAAASSPSSSSSASSKPAASPSAAPAAVSPGGYDSAPSSAYKSRVPPEEAPAPPLSACAAALVAAQGGGAPVVVAPGGPLCLKAYIRMGDCCCALAAHRRLQNAVGVASVVSFCAYNMAHELSAQFVVGLLRCSFLYVCDWFSLPTACRR
jgi:hypothetical protein